LGKVLRFEKPEKGKIIAIGEILKAVQEQKKNEFFDVGKCMKSVILRLGFTEKNIRR